MGSYPAGLLGTIAQYVIRLRIGARFRRNRVRLGDGCWFHGMPLIRIARGSGLVVGNDATVRSDASNPLSQGARCVFYAEGEGARIVIGDRVGLSGAVIFCRSQVSVGSGTLVGAGAVILDSDAHPVCPVCRCEGESGASAPVVIGRDCFIGMRAIVLKGARIADRCVVAAGSVVRGGEYPEGSIIAGNPATIAGVVRMCPRHSAAESS